MFRGSARLSWVGFGGSARNNISDCRSRSGKIQNNAMNYQAGIQSRNKIEV